MSPSTSFMKRLLSFTSLSLRQTPEFPDSVTIRTEESSWCRTYPDSMGDVPLTGYFREDDTVNITCWTQSSMLDDDRGKEVEATEDSTFIWAWIQAEPESFFDGAVAVGNIEQGGLAGGSGCWMHDDDIKGGEDFYLPDEVRWCGDAPHHQVAFPTDSYRFFECRNCTDLEEPACQTTYLTDFPGFTSTGCWKHGSEVEGNSTWVSLIEPPLENCFISPDQFDPSGWHGPPAPECQD